MVYPDRERERQKGRYSRDHSPRKDDDRYHHRRSRSRSDSRDKRRSRDYREHKERSHQSHHSSKQSHDSYERYERYERSQSKKRSQSSQSKISYEQKQQQELQQKIRLGIRNNDLHFNKKLQQAYIQLPQRKQQQLAIQARSPQRVRELILVRELYVSGINDLSEHTITEIMGKYGEIENIQIIKDFAFVKYYRVEDASNACADYHNISASVPHLINEYFKIFFSDHMKRWNVVSNHVDYEIFQFLVPVLYVSVKNDPFYSSEKHLRSVFEKYGFVRNLEVRKNQFPAPKIHVNIEYETLEMAMRARKMLKDKKEKYLGDKKSDLAILINSEMFMRAFPNTSNQVRLQKKRMQHLNPTHSHNMNPLMSSGNSFTNLNSMDPYGSSMGSFGSQNSMTNLKNLQPQPSSSSYQTEDIFAMLEKLNEKKNDSQMEIQTQQEADWVGFFTRNNQFKVQVQFNKLTRDAPFNLQIILNVSHRGDISEPLNRKDYTLAGKFRALNKQNQEAFNEYIKYFTKKNRGGIVFANDYLIYLLPPKEGLNLPFRIKPNELLGLFFNIKN